MYRSSTRFVWSWRCLKTASLFGLLVQSLPAWFTVLRTSCFDFFPRFHNLLCYPPIFNKNSISIFLQPVLDFANPIICGLQSLHYNPIICGLQSSHYNPIICGLQSSHCNPIICGLHLSHYNQIIYESQSSHYKQLIISPIIWSVDTHREFVHAQSVLACC